MIPPSALFPPIDDEKPVIVKFEKNTEDAVNGMPSVVVIDEGDTISEPVNQPVRDGHAFTGWYTDSACITLYVFNEPVDENLILYAGWEKDLPTVTFKAVDMTGADFEPAANELSREYFAPKKTDHLESLYAVDIWNTNTSWRQVGTWSYSYDKYEPVDFPIDITEDITLYALCIFSTITEENSGIALPDGITLQAQTELLNYYITKDLSGTTATQADITLPGKVNGYPIVFIQDMTFQNNESIQKVTFETGLEQIKMQVFNHCTSLSEVILPSTLKEIGYLAFNDTALKSITIPAAVEDIDGRTFNFASDADGTGLTEIIFEGTTPPAITGNIPTSSGEGCTAYVPDDAVSAYQDSGWVQLVGTIKPISERI